MLVAVFSVISMLCQAAEHMPKVSFVTPSIARVQWSPDGYLPGNDTRVCVYKPTHVEVDVVSQPGSVCFRSSELAVVLDSVTSAVSFIDPFTGRTLLSENPARPRYCRDVVEERMVYDDATARMESTANGIVTVRDMVRRDTIGSVREFGVAWTMDSEQVLYGLGSHMEDYMNLLGKTLYLTQHNLKVFVPVLVSTCGYGLLLDAGCAMKYSSALSDSGDKCLTEIEMDAASQIDYYFIKGKDMEDVVKGYRFLTGGVSMMPRYVFGYIQSKERYTSSDDILRTLREYRRRHVPIDMIVQDWNYWPQGWGYMKMDERHYPDPKALADSVHALNARLMISIWPNPQGCPQEEDFRRRGFMLENSVYDAFSADARKLYWSYADDEFFSKGFDAWWCDSSEPLDADWNHTPEPIDGTPYSLNDHQRRWKLNKELLGTTLGVKRSSLYSLYHAMGIYENQRATSDSKRVVNLTRSGFAGQQRYGTIVWNGDVSATWQSFRNQIPAGLNYMATGCPYWTVDVGCFFTGSDMRWFRYGDFPKGTDDPAYRQYYTRMFQWATFLPVLRSHGTDTPREIWHFGEPGTPYYDAILDMINLRYTLNPYIYSMAAAQTRGGYTMARPLAFDFPDDSEVHDIKDQYMFGDFLVCPVTEPDVRTRRVYLPETARWTDYWTGNTLDGGQWIEAECPVSRLPLYVRAGSIVTKAQPAECTDAQRNLPVCIEVYPGADVTFRLYDDEGDGYGYENGNYCLIDMTWDDAARTLSIGASEGNYPASRKFIVRTPGLCREINYDGRAMTVEMP